PIAQLKNHLHSKVLLHSKALLQSENEEAAVPLRCSSFFMFRLRSGQGFLPGCLLNFYYNSLRRIAPIRGIVNSGGPEGLKSYRILKGT
ncbi:MAG TPA: hypothetical protein DHV42_08200, partial [Lachnospiraceae bacterium]|nr:hypothetical protein [Lachnospiraceae bacterium]